LWNESIRLNTVSPAGQMQVAEDDVLPPIPELGVDPRPVKKHAALVPCVVEIITIALLLTLCGIRGDLIAWQNYVLSRSAHLCSSCVRRDSSDVNAHCPLRRLECQKSGDQTPLSLDRAVGSMKKTVSFVSQALSVRQHAFLACPKARQRPSLTWKLSV
jgi:hypothetical protein